MAHGVWLLALVVGCGPKLDIPLDVSLPDGELRPFAAPRAVLDVASADGDPAVRERAIAGMIRGASAETLPRWTMQGTHDPHPWVQAGVVEALWARSDELVGREALLDYATRRSADAYVRAHVAHQLIDEGFTEPLVGLRDAWAEATGADVAPLALVAVRLGNDAARRGVEQALSKGMVRDDISFVGDLGRYGWPGVAEALASDAGWLSEDVGLRLDVVRALLGDPIGERVWRAALRSREVAEAREALDLALSLSPERGAPWVRVAERARDPGVRAAARAVSRPKTVGLAARSPDPYARTVAMQVAERLDVVAARPIVAAGLSDDHPQVQLAAMDAVVALGLDELVPELERIARSDAPLVRVAAYAALVSLGRAPGM